MYLEHEQEQESMFRSQRRSRCGGVIVAARVHVPNRYDVPDTCTDDADADADDDVGPCEDIVVLAKTHSGASEDTYWWVRNHSTWSGGSRVGRGWYMNFLY